jgi:predicted Zn-dependent protease
VKIHVLLVALPLLAQQGVNFYSVEKEQALGRQVAMELRKGLQPVSDAGVDAYVQRIGQELLAQVTDLPFPVQFEVHSGGSSTEPAAVPGGFLFVPVEALANSNDESEFAGLLAHAIGHAVLRHETRSATRGQVVNLASIPLIYMGSWHSGTHADTRASQTLIPLGYLKFQRTLESEADEFGLALMARAGFDASAFKRYVERTQGEDSIRSPLPPREARLTAMQEQIATLPQIGPASSDEFRRAQDIAKSLPGALPKKEPPTLRRK